MLSAKVAAIEFAGDEVRVAVVKTGGRLPKVLELASCTAVYEDPEMRFEAMVEALDKALEELRSRPAAFVLCARSMYSVVRTMTIPLKSRRRVAAAVQFELEPYLAFPIEELLVDFHIVGQFDGETEVLAMGIRRAHIEEELAILSAVGIEGEAVGLDAVGLTALWQAGQKKLKGLRAVLHARESDCCLAVTYDKTIAYFRCLPCTGEELQEDPAKVAREVQNTLRAFLAMWRGGGQITELHVTGVELARHECDALSSALRLPVLDEVMLSKMKGGALALEKGPAGAKHNAWESAIGAAMGASGAGYSLDFIKAEREWQGAARGVVKHLMFTSCLALFVLLGWAVFYYQGTARNAFEAHRIQEEIGVLTKAMEEMADEGFGEGVDDTPFRSPSFLEILADISTRMPESKVNISEIRLSGPEVQSYWLRIQGSASDAAVLGQIFNDLRNSPLYRIEEEPDRSMSGDVTTFTVEAFRREAESNEVES